MTLMEIDLRSSASAEFDPLVELAGVWNTHLARYFQTFLEDRFAKWECVHGRLAVVPPAEPSKNSFGQMKLGALLDAAASDRDFVVYSTLNMTFDPDTWLQPDVNVLHTVPEDENSLWVPVDHFAMPIEFLSPSTRYRDELVKPELLAAAGVPYYMLVDINRAKRAVTITQFKLVAGSYHEIARATEGVFTMIEPFEVMFEVAKLLEPLRRGGAEGQLSQPESPTGSP